VAASNCAEFQAERTFASRNPNVGNGQCPYVGVFHEAAYATVDFRDTRCGHLFLADTVEKVGHLSAAAAWADLAD